MSRELTNNEQKELLVLLENRFNKNMNRHPNQKWESIKEKLLNQPEKMWTVNEMERTGGEPDVIGDDAIFMDCSPESPTGRRSICYDRLALEKRKKNKPTNDALTLATELGIKLLTEEEYRQLQIYGEFDLKSSSWVQTPDKIRKLGGAIYCDRRYDTVFTYHNGAESYYSARGFRGKIVL